MALTAYIQQTQRLLNDEQAMFYSTSDLTAYVNIARNTISTQSECLIFNGSLNTVLGTQKYALSAITPAAGLQSIVNVRSVMSTIAGINQKLDRRGWQWFSNYYISGSSTAAIGVSTIWSIRPQGSGGTLWFSPVPNGVIAMTIEATWTPIALVDDTTQEVLSYPWTDAVPYFTAYMAYLNAQRGSDASRMLALFNGFMKAARVGVTPEWVSDAFPGLKMVPAGAGGEGSTGA